MEEVMDMVDMMMPSNCSMDMGMPMQFYFGYLHGGLLFKTWTISTVGEMIGSIVAILLLAIAYEGLKSLREFLLTFNQQRKDKRRNQNPMSTQNETTGLVSKESQQNLWVSAPIAVAREYISLFHLIQSILHVIQVGLGYILMLIAMSYNGWLFLAVCFGAGLGYFIFAACRRRSSTAQTFTEQNEHCE